MAKEKIGSIFYEVEGDTRKLSKKLKKTEKDAKVSGNKAGKGFSSGFSSAIAIGMAKAMAALYAFKKAFDFAKQAKNAARDAQETGNKFNTVFSSMEKRANAMADAFATSFGLAGSTARELLGNTGDLLVGFGFAEKKALDLSVQVNSLAQDLASFTNFSGGAKGASAALTKGILGETESVKALGIVLRQNTDEFRAQMRVKVESEGMTVNQARAEILLAEAYRQSSKAVGDYARTQNDLANQERRTNEQVKKLKEELGKGLIPMFLELNKAAGGWLIIFNAILGVEKKIIRDTIAVKTAWKEMFKSMSDTDISKEISNISKEWENLDKVSSTIIKFGLTTEIGLLKTLLPDVPDVKLKWYLENPEILENQLSDLGLKAEALQELLSPKKIDPIEIETTSLDSLSTELSDLQKTISEIDVDSPLMAGLLKQANTLETKLQDVTDKLNGVQIGSMADLESELKALQKTISITDADSPLIDGLLEQANDLEIKIQDVTDKLEGIQIGSMADLESELSGLEAQIDMTFDPDSLKTIYQQIDDVKGKISKEEIRLIGLEVEATGLDVSGLKAKGSDIQFDDDGIQAEMDDFDINALALEDYNSTLDKQQDIWANLGDAQSQAMGSLAASWAGQIRLFETANSMLQQFLNTLMQVALQQVALAAIGTFTGGGILGLIGGELGIGAHDGGTFQDGKKVASFAGGGDFTVPSGYPNDSYPIMVESGERVQVTPSNAVGNDSKLLNQINSSIQAMNMNLVSKNMSPIVSVGIDSIPLTKNIKKTENRLTKSGVKLDS
jgi:hypothetical protein